MLIGQDYEKIEWNFMGLELLEPNALIGDTIILLFALYFYFKLKKMNINTPFYSNWRMFYLLFGIGFFIGGFGHLLFNYTVLWGKYPSWFFGIVATYCIEQAMISIYPKISARSILVKLSQLKLIIALVGEICIILFSDLNAKIELGMIFPTATSVIGLSLSLGVLGVMYQKKIHPSFKYLWLSALILVPSAAFQIFKINFAWWFDRNDASHVLLIVGMILYYQTLKRYQLSKN